MFNGCSGLTSLDISSFNTINVLNMDRMFRGCSSLTNLNISNNDISYINTNKDTINTINASNNK